MILSDSDTPSSVASQVILRNLPKVPGPKQYQSKGTINIWCPFHGDPGAPMKGTPSMMLNLTTTEKFSVGFAYCYSCSKKSNWNEIAAKYGLERYGEGDEADLYVVKPDFNKMGKRMLGEEESESLDSICPTMRVPLHLPWQKGVKWRSIKSSTLMAIGAHYGLDEETEDQVVILPVRSGGELVGAVKGRWKASKKKDGKKAGPNYINSPGKWTRDKGLFLLDESLAMGDGTTIILTEGPRDSLRLYQEGLPAASILGVTNWTRKKRDVLLESGVENIILCMDGDEAGREARHKIKPDLTGYFSVYVFNLNKWADRLGLDKLDPGEAPDEVIARLRKMYNRISGE